MVPYIFFGCCARGSSKTYLDDLDIHYFARSIFDRTNVHVNRYTFGKATRSPFSGGEVIAEGGKNSFMLRLSWKKRSNRRLVYVKPTMGTRERKWSLIGMKRALAFASMRKKLACFIAPPAPYFDAKDHHHQATSLVVEELWVLCCCVLSCVLQTCSCVTACP